MNEFVVEGGGDEGDDACDCHDFECRAVIRWMSAGVTAVQNKLGQLRSLAAAGHDITICVFRGGRSNIAAIVTDP
jgi:hypothetical protein